MLNGERQQNNIRKQKTKNKKNIDIFLNSVQYLHVLSAHFIALYSLTLLGWQNKFNKFNVIRIERTKKLPGIDFVVPY